jgi:iron complex transport system permease protein
MKARKHYKLILAVLIPVILGSLFIAAGLGAKTFSPYETWTSILMHLTGKEWAEGCGIPVLSYKMIWTMRIPRVLLGFIVGASLAVCGVAMQALVRNNLADPFILGVSSGASATAALFMVFGVFGFLGVFALPLSAFLGALASIIFVYTIARVGGRINIPQMLLAGVAVAMIMDAITSFIVFGAKDAFKIHNVDFWLSGSLAGAKWAYLTIPFVVMLACLAYLLISYRSLNAIVLGEETAGSLGISVQRFQKSLVLIVSLLAGVAISVSGTIGFVGLMMPHLARMLLGSDHKRVLPFSALLGGTLVVWADVAARVLAAPEEMPVGLVTALVGAPFFVILLKRKNATRAMN